MKRVRRSVFAAAVSSLFSLSVAFAAPPSSAQGPADAPAPRPRPAPPAGSLGAALEAARTSDYAAAEKSLLAIQGADRPAALVALSQIMLEQGRFADADKYAAQVTGAPAERLAALALRGQVLAAQGKVDDAIKLLEPSKDAAGAGGRRVRLVLGELLIRAGRRADAEPVLLKFADEYNSDAIPLTDAEGLAMVGHAMHLLRHEKEGNQAFNESEQAQRGRVETLLWRADQWLDKYDTGHAGEALTEALKIAPHRADAMVMLARAKIEDAYDFDAAEKLVTDALAVNPKHTGAQAVRAGIALRDMSLTQANAAIDAGLGVDPSDLELLSLRAAARFLADDKAGFEAAKKQIFAQNKEFSQAYAIIGEYAEWEHRYDDVVAMMKEAVALDPKDSKAWAQLGLTETRAGDEAGGVKALEQAWKGDHYNVRVLNTLDKLYGKWIPSMYESGTSGVFAIRYPKDDKAVLERYVPRMLGEAWGVMKAHYMFTPTVPVGIELYRERQHFSVRTSGLPNIGIQGVCFGHLVAAMSPDSEPFNWGNVLWHELGHVFAIQLSRYHVPRWFTEGLSEYETMIRRPEWQRELDPELYLALARNALPGSLDMNRAFTHASGDLDVTIAYYAASQMIAFTAEQFGFPKITRALALWGEGKRTGDVIQSAFGVSAADYDARYRAWQKARLARYDGQYMFDGHAVPLDDARAAAAAHPQEAPAHVAYGLALARAHKIEDAQHEVDEALRIDPKSMDAHFVGSKIARAAKDAQAEQAHLDAIRASGGDGYTIEQALAVAAEARQDKAAQRAALEAAHRFDPTQVDVLHDLYEMATAEKRDADALALLGEIARLDQHDAHAYDLLLARLVDAKRWDEAVRVGEAALYVDVQSASMHQGYARALAATGKHEAAAFELESALLCAAEPKDKAETQALLARERLTLGDAAGARAHRDQALSLDPQNADARALKL